MAANAWGCGKHLLLVSGLLCVVVAYGVVQNWNTVALMVDNLAVMNEKAAQAEQIRHPDDLVDYLEAHPEQGSLVAYDVGEKEDGIFYGASTSRPLTGTPHLILLAEYARQVESGMTDPNQAVPLHEIDRYALPGAGRSRHRQVRERFVQNGHVQADSTVPLRRVARGAFRKDDPAAADWLMARLGPSALRRGAATFGFANSDPPLPQSGLHLLWNANSLSEADSLPGADSPSGVDSLLERQSRPPRDRLVERVYARMRRLAEEPRFRRAQRERLARRGSGLSLRDQRTFAHRTAPRGTAAEYARFLQQVAVSSLGRPPVTQRIQTCLERSAETDSLALSVQAVGSIGGDAPPRVVVLFLEELPMAVFYHLLQTGLDKGFYLRLMGDDGFFSRVREQLSGPSTSLNPPRKSEKEESTGGRWTQVDEGTGR
jgi:hypothetical protein